MFTIPKLPIDRSNLWNNKTADQLVGAYKENYQLSDISFQQLEKHAALEGELTDKLLISEPETRSEVFSSAYSRLYRELTWLVGTGTHSGGKRWARIMRPGASIFEVGSGKGYLIDYLASQGFRCVATELSTERIERDVLEAVPRHSTDGVHLSRFEPEGNYDYVISDQVVEHLHPDDILEHFREARKLLKEGGCYIVRTPHACAGPYDLSRVFNEDRPVFMHLHEFTHLEMEALTRECGYRSIKAVFHIPKTNFTRISGTYMRFCLAIDRLERRFLHTQSSRRRFRSRGKYVFVPNAVWIVLQK